VPEGLRETEAGQETPTIPPRSNSAQPVLAEALSGHWSFAGRRGGEDLALVYLQLCLYLAPTHPSARCVAGHLYDSVQEAGTRDQGL